MLTIHRFNITKEITEIEIQEGAKILNVGICKNIITIWAMVETENPMHKKVFLTYGTGANMDALMEIPNKYIGTIQKANDYAFHIFEVLE